VAGQDAADGTPFGRYRLVELLGRGGMGEVWRAYDTATDRVVALKLLPANLSEDEDFQRRFRREAHAAARLDTPHVVPIYDYGEIDGRLFVSMRLINGRDLAVVLADGPVDPARAVRIIDQVAKALHAAHEFGLIHRDIKPSNILLDRDDFAYLIDFGIARAADDTRLTKTGGTIGTFAYIAPERLDPHAEEDARVDIYSLACVLYEALTGEPPFPGSTTAHLMYAHAHTPPPQPSSTQPDVSARFDAVIAKGMAKDPDNRYATTVELADAARDAVTEPIQRPAPTTAQPAGEPARPTYATTLDDLARTRPEPTLGGDATSATADPPPAVAANQSEPPRGRPFWPAADGAGRPHPPPSRAPQQPVSRLPVPARRNRTPWIIAGVAAVVVLVAAAVGIRVSVGHHAGPTSQRGPISEKVTTSRTPTSSQTSSIPPVVLPFADLWGPYGVAVDTAGTLYVADSKVGGGRLLKLAAGSSTQEVLPFTGLAGPTGVAVDTAGNVYVIDRDYSHSRARLLKLQQLPGGGSDQAVLPVTGLKEPEGLVVDSAGNLYVADAKFGDPRVLKLAAGSLTQEVLPFTGLEVPQAVAVDNTGSVYVADQTAHRVLKLAAGSSTQEVLPFTGVDTPRGMAVDKAGNVYVADMSNGVLKLAVGSSSSTVLPFTWSRPMGLAVDDAGNVYVTDSGDNRVVKLSA
jgi:serine/threonine-protein kinase